MGDDDLVLHQTNGEDPNGRARQINVVCVGSHAATLERIARGIRRRWPRTSIAVTQSGSGALEMVAQLPADLVLVHTDLRDMFAQVLVGELRSISNVPIIVLTREADDAEAVTTLERGADDYFQYPCGTWQLIARTWAVLRRAGLIAPGEENRCFLVSGRLLIDPVSYEANLDGRRVRLTPTEFRLLYLLAKHHGDVVSHRDLEEEIGGDQRLGTRSAKKHIQKLRGKLGDRAGSPHWIASVYGVGYRFVGPSPRWQGPPPGN